MNNCSQCSMFVAGSFDQPYYAEKPCRIRSSAVCSNCSNFLSIKEYKYCRECTGSRKDYLYIVKTVFNLTLLLQNHQDGRISSLFTVATCSTICLLVVTSLSICTSIYANEASYALTQIHLSICKSIYANAFCVCLLISWWQTQRQHCGEWALHGAVTTSHIKYKKSYRMSKNNPPDDIDLVMYQLRKRGCKLPRTRLKAIAGKLCRRYGSFEGYLCGKYVPRSRFKSSNLSRKNAENS